MKIDIFKIPVFIDEIELEKIDIGDPPLNELWLSETKTSFLEEYEVPNSTYEYLSEIIARNLGPENLIGANPKFSKIWRNSYQETDWQDIHIHPTAAWSFIIYETVEKSKTVFMNPSVKDIQNHLGNTVPGFPLDFRPDLGPGNIIIFPSFLQHFVMSGNVGTTLAGNVYMDYD